jgi:hypothetical protein
MPPARLILSGRDTVRPEFSRPTGSTGVTRTRGTILARGRRTVTATRRPRGVKDDPTFSNDHQVFPRAAGAPLRHARRLAHALVRAFVPPGRGLTRARDETWERRGGRTIRKRGHERAPLASSTGCSGAARGRRGIVRTLVVSRPGTSPPGARPILSRPGPTPQVSAPRGRRHQTSAAWARQMSVGGRRGLPGADLTVGGDQADRVSERGRSGRQRRGRLIAPLRLRGYPGRDVFFAASPCKKVGWGDSACNIRNLFAANDFWP